MRSSACGQYHSTPDTSVRLAVAALLCRFAQDKEPLEICEVLFAWDEKRGGDVVFAAGWNAKVGLLWLTCRLTVMAAESESQC